MQYKSHRIKLYFPKSTGSIGAYGSWGSGQSPWFLSPPGLSRGWRVQGWGRSCLCEVRFGWRVGGGSQRASMNPACCDRKAVEVFRGNRLVQRPGGSGETALRLLKLELATPVALQGSYEDPLV